MQYGQAMDWILWEMLRPDPAIVSTHIHKCDLSNLFNHVNLQPYNTPKLSLTFPCGVNNMGIALFQWCGSVSVCVCRCVVLNSTCSEYYD